MLLSFFRVGPRRTFDCKKAQLKQVAVMNKVLALPSSAPVSRITGLDLIGACITSLDLINV